MMILHIRGGRDIVVEVDGSSRNSEIAVVGSELPMYALSNPDNTIYLSLF